MFYSDAPVSFRSVCGLVIAGSLYASDAFPAFCPSLGNDPSAEELGIHAGGPCDYAREL